MQYKKYGGRFLSAQTGLYEPVRPAIPAFQADHFRMGEIIKHGLIKDAAYYEWLMAHHDAILALEPAVMEER